VLKEDFLAFIFPGPSLKIQPIVLFRARPSVPPAPKPCSFWLPSFRFLDPGGNFRPFPDWLVAFCLAPPGR
jgi:hypothetical protein